MSNGGDEGAVDAAPGGLLAAGLTDSTETTGTTTAGETGGVAAPPTGAFTGLAAGSVAAPRAGTFCGPEKREEKASMALAVPVTASAAVRSWVAVRSESPSTLLKDVIARSVSPIAPRTLAIVELSIFSRWSIADSM